MARRNDDTPTPTSADGTTTAEAGTVPAIAWAPPTSDQEFVFENIAGAPDWVDRGWASFDRGPALAVPAGDPWGEGPYTTLSARKGDTVKFVANPPHFEVIRSTAVPKDEEPRVYIAQQSAASEEDLLKTGMITPADLSDDAKAQVASRSPKMAAMLEAS